MKKRKRAYYTGELAQPMAYVPPIIPPGKLAGPTEDWPPALAETWRIAVEKARQEDAREFWNGAILSLRRLVALSDHFNIDRSLPGWSRNLALSLAYRHEPDLNRGAGVLYAELFARYGIDPNQPDADFPLALALAERHVPGLRLESRKSRQSRLSTIDLIRLVFAVVEVREHQKQASGEGSDREVVAILMDNKRLRSIIPVAAADEVTSMIKSHGNDRRNMNGSLSDRTLREYLRQMKSARQCYREGTANDFQKQFVDEVLPFLHNPSGTDTQERGQN